MSIKCNLFTCLSDLVRSRFTSSQQEPPRGPYLRTHAQRDWQPKDANTALAWTWAPEVMKPLRDIKCYILMLRHNVKCACAHMTLRQGRQSQGEANRVSDNEILSQVLMPDLLSLLLQ